ncbi:MAG TPA: hypothetical protein VNA24_04025 [Hyalangium sp.]|nr:hypothetical protein [Hyalangium sp.]
MATQYTIYLVNNGVSTKDFWGFLQPPDELASLPGVFANSSAHLSVDPNVGSQLNKFVIPVQYVVGAGASNQAVELHTRVISSFDQETDLGQGWLANYANAPPNKGPLIVGADAPAKDKIEITANNFNRKENEANNWFSNMSFGIQTSAGYMGMTWSPDPGDKRTISPKLSFYVTSGSFGTNDLADWTDVNSKAASITLADFDNRREATVTLTETGEWTVTRGRPPSVQRRSLLDTLLQSHLRLAEAHSHLTQLVGSGVTGTTTTYDVSSCDQKDTVVSVQWDDGPKDNAGITLRGTLTVRAALGAAFTAFTLAGVRFSITSAPPGGTQIRFSYSGERSVQQIKALFVAGANLLLTCKP